MSNVSIVTTVEVEMFSAAISAGVGVVTPESGFQGNRGELV
jgi:hypothetical protein